MADKNSNEFGAVSTDAEGNVELRDVQKRGRVSFPAQFLEYIGCEPGDAVIITADDGELKVKKATSDNIAATNFARGLLAAVEVKKDGRQDCK